MYKVVKNLKLGTPKDFLGPSNCLSLFVLAYSSFSREIDNHVVHQGHIHGLQHAHVVHQGQVAHHGHASRVQECLIEL